MKKIATHRAQRARQTTIRTVMLVFSLLLLVTGLILLLIDPIKRLNRNRIANDALHDIEQKIEAQVIEAEMTYVVPATGNEVEGEGYDFIGETEETVEEYDDSEMVTLTSIGILEIDAIGCRYSVWDEATQVSLRYGLGHYVDSVIPGEQGNATILGHNYRDGSMFHKLGDLQIGDTVVFTGKDGQSQTFYVTESLIISADDILNYALGDVSDTTQLTLITCTYEYGRYGWRRVVICRPAGDSSSEETTAAETTAAETAAETTAATEATEASTEVLETTAEETPT